MNQVRNRQVDNKEIDEGMKKGIANVIENEDVAMIVDCFELMGAHDLMSLNPVLLPSDAGSVRARRILQSLIDEEQVQLNSK